MKQLFYIFFIIGCLFLITGILLEESCYEKTPQEFYRDEVCKWIAKTK